MPAEYINHMEIMFKDIDLSKGLTIALRSSKQKQGKGSFYDTVNLKVLNVGSWARDSDTIPITLPVELEDFIPEVEEYYKSKYNGRKIQWHHHLASGTINFKSDVGNFELEVTTMQMAVLFAWNRRPKVRVSQLPRITCLSSTLQSVFSKNGSCRRNRNIELNLPG